MTTVFTSATAPTRAYDDGMARIIHGDAVAEMKALSTERERTVIITDPVWPNAPSGMFDVDDPFQLFARVAAEFPRVARRVVVILGCSSDPRFLMGIPSSMKFVRVIHLRYALPSNAGTILNGGDVGYVFGDHKASPGRTLLPGETTSSRSTRNRADAHPCPRNYDHMRWVVGTFSNEGDTVLDPFCGSGTTLVAAKNAGRKSIGIEIEKKYIDVASERLRQDVLPLPALHRGPLGP